MFKFFNKSKIKNQQEEQNGTLYHVLQMKDDLIRAIEKDPTKKYVLEVMGKFNTPEEARLEKKKIIKEARRKNPNACLGNKDD
jgi:hypothetical protein